MKLNTRTTIVPNWYTKKILESVLDEKINKMDFNDFKDFVDGSGLVEDITNDIRALWREFNHE